MRRTEQCDAFALGEELVSVLHHLMRAANEVELVSGAEGVHDVGAEQVAGAARRLPIALPLQEGVGPQEIGGQ